MVAYEHAWADRDRDALANKHANGDADTHAIGYRHEHTHAAAMVYAALGSHCDEYPDGYSYHAAHGDADTYAYCSGDGDAHEHASQRCTADRNTHEHAARHCAANGNCDADAHRLPDGGPDEHTSACGWVSHPDSRVGRHAAANTRSADAHIHGSASSAAHHSRGHSCAIADGGALAYDACVDAHAWAVPDAAAQPNSMAYIARARG